MDGILFIYLPLLALFLCLIARIINKLYLKKRRILAEYDKKGRELMKQRIVTDRALIQEYGISEGHTVAYYGVAIQIHEVIADNNMVRDEVVNNCTAFNGLYSQDAAGWTERTCTTK